MQTFPAKNNANTAKTLETSRSLCYKQWVEKREERENSGFCCVQRGPVIGWKPVCGAPLGSPGSGRGERRGRLTAVNGSRVRADGLREFGWYHGRVLSSHADEGLSFFAPMTVRNFPQKKEK